MNRKLRNGLIIAGIGTLGMLGAVSLNTDIRKTNVELRAYAAQSATDADEVTVNGWEDVDNTMYCVASVSKVYVTAAVMQLVDQGKVDLDAPVTDYIDDFKMADERYKDITVRMLMNHSSGLMGTTFKDDTLINDNVSDHERVVLDNLAAQRLKADPGAYSSYCNDGFALLSIIVERVTGMSYTTYVEKNIAGKLGATSIGTAENKYENENLVDVYSDGKCYGNEYCMDLGSGGIISNAKDTCEFGSAFFKGDNRLLSEKSKNEMNSLATESPYSFYGLGWDEVSIKQYEDAGVKVVSKGGDTLNQHANLLVAPDEEISVCVTTSGGNSGYNRAVCEALMNIALEEQGIEIEAVTAPEAEFKSEVPASYKQYEGYYSAVSLGGIVEVTFPEMKYMLLKTKAETTTESYFKYTDKGFVRVKGDIESDNVKADPDYANLTFEKINGGIYIVGDMISNHSGLINSESSTIVAEMMVPNPVSGNAISAWKERENKKYAVISDKYSSYIYDTPFTEIFLLDDTGYIVVNMEIGARILRIVDENTAEFYTTIPGDASRDVFDISVDDGVIHTSAGYTFIPVDECDMLTSDVSEVSLKSENAAWFRIDDSLANTSISIDRPKNSVVYEYDKYGDVIYSSHTKDYSESIPLSKGGYIVFLGEDGGNVSIKYNR